MKLSTLIFISMRYTLTKSTDAFVSFISKTSTIGLILGIAVLIIVLSVMNGFAHELKTRILGSVPHAVLSSRSNGILDWESLAHQINEVPGVAGVAPLNSVEAVIMSPHGNSSFALINGIIPSEEVKVSKISEEMIEGKLSDLNKQKFGIILGQSIASNLDVIPGDYVILVLPKLTGNITGFSPVFKRFKVVGIYNTNSQVDSLYSFIHIDDAAILKRRSHTVESLRLSFNNVMEAPKLARQIRDQVGRYSVKDWTYSYGNLFAAIHLEKRMIGLLLFFIVLVAAFNVLATLVMIVQEKKGEIAILRTMGAGTKEIIMIFMLQGTLIGLAGSVIGTILGVLGAVYISDIFQFIEQIFSVQFLSSDTYFISYLPSQLQSGDVITVVSIAFFSCILATIYPAWRATRVDPARVLRS